MLFAFLQKEISEEVNMKTIFVKYNQDIAVRKMIGSKLRFFLSNGSFRVRVR